jgi:hypothetical protein
MAIDGVGVIDSDLAHDVYHTFMDLYDAGEPIETIRATVEQLRADNDDVDDELFITAYALALWEIGQLDTAVLSEVARAIEQRAFVNYLMQSEKASDEANRRQQTLKQFWTKINQPTAKARKPKPNSAQKQLVFHQGSVLAFQLPDGSYRAAILLLTDQRRGSTSYFFAQPTFTGPYKPTLEEVKAGEIMGRIYSPPDFPHRRIGFDVVGMDDKQLRSIAGHFEIIGHLEIAPAAQCCGSQTGATSFESFASSFGDFKSFLDEKMTARTHPNKVFSVQKLL